MEWKEKTHCDMLAYMLLIARHNNSASSVWSLFSLSSSPCEMILSIWREQPWGICNLMKNCCCHGIERVLILYWKTSSVFICIPWLSKQLYQLIGFKQLKMLYYYKEIKRSNQLNRIPAKKTNPFPGSLREKHICMLLTSQIGLS